VEYFFHSVILAFYAAPWSMASKSKSSHTILLAQFGDKPNTRQWMDYDNVKAAMDGIAICCLLHVKHKQEKPILAIFQVYASCLKIN
jgi:hypothetical protein